MHLILIGIMFTIAICTVVFGTKNKWPKEVYYFIGFSMLLLTFVCGITVLNWEITGSEVGVKVKEDLNLLTTTMNIEIDQRKRDTQLLTKKLTKGQNQTNENIRTIKKDIASINTDTINLIANLQQPDEHKDIAAILSPYNNAISMNAIVGKKSNMKTHDEIKRLDSEIEKIKKQINNKLKGMFLIKGDGSNKNLK